MNEHNVRFVLRIVNIYKNDLVGKEVFPNKTEIIIRKAKDDLLANCLFK